MRILVTGAGGFVGHYVVDHLLAVGEHTIHALGRELDGLTLPSPQCWPLDLRDGEAVHEAIDRIAPEVVIHLAGTTSVAESWARPKQTFETNVLATLNILEAIPPGMVTRWVNAGSAEEYQPSPEKLQETCPLAPLSPYGTSKVAQEWLLQQIAPRLQMKLWQFRAFNQTGPGQDTRFVVPSLALQVLQAKHHIISEVKVGDLSPIRDFMDVRDSSRIYAEAAQGKIPPGTYNLCSGTGRSIASVLHDLSRLAGVEPTIAIDPARFRPADVPSLVGDASCLLETCRQSVLSYDWESTLLSLLSDLEDFLDASV